MLGISCHFIPKPLTLQMDHAKLLDVLTSLPVSHAILPRAMCFAHHIRQTMQYVVIFTQVDMHLGQSEYVYLIDYIIIKNNSKIRINILN